MNPIDTQWLGRTEYLQCEEQQALLRALVIAGKANEALLLTEHESVYAYGRRHPDSDQFPGPSVALDAPIVRSKRGGLLTYHGPGQIMIYCVIDIKRRGLSIPQFIEILQTSVIHWLLSIGVTAHATEGCPGVWVGEAKICSVGLHFRRWVSMYGMSLNLDPDLAYFRHIKPCGFSGERVTSVREQGGEVRPVWLVWRDLGAAIVREIETKTVDKECQ